MERRRQETTEEIRVPKTFGARESPACAIYALQQEARDNAENYRDFLEIVITDFYMDYFVKPVRSTDDALQPHQLPRQVLGF